MHYGDTMSIIFFGSNFPSFIDALMGLGLPLGSPHFAPKDWMQGGTAP